MCQERVTIQQRDPLQSVQLQDKYKINLAKCQELLSSLRAMLVIALKDGSVSETLLCVTFNCPSPAITIHLFLLRHFYNPISVCDKHGQTIISELLVAY